MHWKRQQVCHIQEKEKENEREISEQSAIINWNPARTVHATMKLHSERSLYSNLGVPAQRPHIATRLPFNWPGSAMRCPRGVPAQRPRNSPQ